MKTQPLLSLIVSLVSLAGTAFADSYYVDPRQGNDAADGSKATPFKTIARAMKNVDGKGGEVNLAPGSTFQETVVIKKGGLPESPLVIDGHGAVVNLGDDITKGPWIKTDDGYTLDHVFPKPIDTGNYQTSPVYVNGLPVMGDHPKGPAYAPRAWHGGYIRTDNKGRLVLVFPNGLTPENSVVVITGITDLNGETAAPVSGVRMESASNVTVKKLTCAFATNDGFNFHGSGKAIRLENVKALFNADEGMSAHETYEVDVHDSETAFNGSQGGGVQDIGQSVTNYTNFHSHQNRSGGFQFDGGTHRLENVVSYGNIGRNLPKPRPEVTIELVNCQETAPADKVIPTVADPSAALDPAKTVEEGDRLGRFLQVRPAAAF